MKKGSGENPLLNSEGMALLLTLMVLAVITAMVVEFAYGVYINTSALRNWQDSQRLSFIAKSAVNMAAETIYEKNSQSTYTYPGAFDIPYDNPVKDAEGKLLVRIEDENAKFNVNSLIYPNGLLNEKAYRSFLRLLNALEISPDLADRLADWIDPDSEPRLQDSEEKAKNGYIDSIDELLLIRGMDRKSYERLMPYVTIYGNGLININGAEVPVLLSLSDAIDRDMAERIVKYRNAAPFERTQDIMKIAGFETVGASLMGSITVKGGFFHVIATATSGGTKRIIESTIEVSGGRPVVRHWREM